MPLERDDFVPITIYVLRSQKRVLKYRKRRTGDDYREQLKPAISALIEETKKEFGAPPDDFQ